MATPTPLKQPPHPHQQAMTPSSFTNHLGAASPLPTAPRSVGQSPAHLSRKSPANAATIQHHPSGIGSSGSNPGSGGLTYDSPTAAALGLNLNLNLPGLVESVTNANVRGDEDERRRRIESILAILKTRPGRVSQEGVERLAKMTGLECLWQDGPDGARTLSIAGSGVLIDMDFKKDLITRVALSFPTSSESLSKVADNAAKILQRDLTVKGTSINTNLVPFARHLEQLSKLDKLSSSSPQLNCYEAIWGIYVSLKRIFEWQKKKMMMNGDTNEKMIEREVMCKHSGRPKMHEGRRVGLSLEYWMERRLIGREDTEDDEELESRTWTLIIECESSPAELYPSIRISRDWVSEGVVKPKDHDQRDELFDEPPEDVSPMIDWLEPPPIYLTHHTANTTSNVTGTSQQHQPDVRFVAILDPPVVVPLHIAYEIYNLVGVQIPQESLRATIYDELVLERKTQSHAQTQTHEGGIRKVNIERDVFVLSGGDKSKEERIKRHRYDLYVPKPDYGRVIEEIPFSHPRQLVEILPILRQYAILSTLIPSNPNIFSAASQPTSNTTIEATATATEADLVSFLSDSDARLPTKNKNDSVQLLQTQIDITLSTHAAPNQPKMTIIFPIHEKKGENMLATAVVEIHPNGDLKLSELSDLDGVLAIPNRHDGEMMDIDNEQESADQRRKILERVLEISEDIGIWVEFILQNSAVK